MLSVPMTGLLERPNGNNVEDRKPGCPIPLQSGCSQGLPLPKSLEEGVKMQCSNAQCPYQNQLMHPECFQALEDNLVKIMSNLGSARNWTDAQRRSNLWDKKGLTLIQKKCRCLCGMGLMRLDQGAMFLANRNAAAAPPKIRRGKKNLPKLNFSSARNAAAGQFYNRDNKKTNNYLRSIKSTNGSFIGASSFTNNYSYTGRWATSHAFHGEWRPETRNTGTDTGWQRQNSASPFLASTGENSQVQTRPRTFISRKVDGNISYAEVALSKPGNEQFLFDEIQFPKTKLAENQCTVQSQSLFTAFRDLHIKDLDQPRSNHRFKTVQQSTIKSDVSILYDGQNSSHYDGTNETSEYNNEFDTTGEFFTSAPLSSSSSPPETPCGSLPVVNSSAVASEKDDEEENGIEESIGYHDLFCGPSFFLGEMLVANRYWLSHD